METLMVLAISWTEGNNIPPWWQSPGLNAVRVVEFKAKFIWNRLKFQYEFDLQNYIYKLSRISAIQCLPQFFLDKISWKKKESINHSLCYWIFFALLPIIFFTFKKWQLLVITKVYIVPLDHNWGSTFKGQFFFQ